MEEVLKVIIGIAEFSKENANKNIRQMIIYVFILFILEVSFIISKQLGFCYTGGSISIDTVIMYFYSYQFIVALIYFTFSLLTFRYIPSIAIKFLGIILGYFLVKATKRKDRLTSLFQTFNIIDKNGRQGKNHEKFNRIFTEILDEEKVIRFCDFLVSFIVTLLFIYANVIHGKSYFPRYIDDIVNAVLWVGCIYWFFNVVALKSFSHSKEYVDRFLIKIKPYVGHKKILLRDRHVALLNNVNLTINFRNRQSHNPTYYYQFFYQYIKHIE